ncbi:MAG: hypothetical protein PVJ76_04220 [Gemmatimonadota bacterium]
MKTFLKWAVVFAVATFVDLLARFAIPFQMTRVLAVEAVLFPAAAAAFLVLMRKGPSQTGFRRKLQIILIGGFFLAGLRSGLWAAGIPVGTVNLLVLAAAVLTWVAYRVRKGMAANQAKPPHS